MGRRLSLLVFGGTEAEREALTSELIEALRLFTRTDDAGPRLLATDDADVSVSSLRSFT